MLCHCRLPAQKKLFQVQQSNGFSRPNLSTKKTSNCNCRPLTTLHNTRVYYVVDAIPYNPHTQICYVPNGAAEIRYYIIQLQLVPVVRGKHTWSLVVFQPSTQACTGFPTSFDLRKARQRARQGRAEGVPIVVPAVLQVQIFSHPG